jgi:small subunit ribosomal protein S17
MAEEETPQDVEETPAAEELEAAAAEETSSPAPTGPDTPAPTPAAEPQEVLAPKERRRRARAAKAARSKVRPARTPEERQAERRTERARKAQERRAGRAKAQAKTTAGGSGEPTPPREHSVGNPKVRQGIVVSDKADKTIVVRIDAARRHRRYQKIVRTSQTLHAHDEANDAHAGDTVTVRECRPLSRTKRWRLVEVVERAR